MSMLGATSDQRWHSKAIITTEPFFIYCMLE